MCFERHLKDSRHFFVPIGESTLNFFVSWKTFFIPNGEKSASRRTFSVPMRKLFECRKTVSHHTVLTKPLVFLNCSQITRWSYAPNNLFGSVEHLCKAWIKPKTTLGKTPWNIAWELYLAAGAKKAQNHYQKAIWDLILTWSQQDIN